MKDVVMPSRNEYAATSENLTNQLCVLFNLRVLASTTSELVTIAKRGSFEVLLIVSTTAFDKIRLKR